MLTSGLHVTSFGDIVEVKAKLCGHVAYDEHTKNVTVRKPQHRIDHQPLPHVKSDAHIKQQIHLQPQGGAIALTVDSRRQIRPRKQYVNIRQQNRNLNMQLQQNPPPISEKKTPSTSTYLRPNWHNARRSVNRPPGAVVSLH
jgi:hypothetical protein